jgi:flavin-dependent dehydrogenase
VRKGLGLPPLNASPALEAEVFLDKVHEKKYQGTVHFDFGEVPEGYAWIFPKRDHLSIGVFSTRKKCSTLLKHLHDYLKQKGLKDARIASLKGHLIPIGPQLSNIVAKKNVILLGDAAGLADPITGEGIYHALKQVDMASGCIKKYLSGEFDTLDYYNTLIKKEFVTELKYASYIAHLLYRMPRLSHWALKRKGEKIMGYYLDVITGEKTYGELFLKTMNPFNLL